MEINENKQSKWIRKYDNNTGYYYFENTETGESQWDEGEYMNNANNANNENNANDYSLLDKMMYVNPTNIFMKQNMSKGDKISLMCSTTNESKILKNIKLKEEEKKELNIKLFKDLDPLKETIVNGIEKVFEPKCIYERSDVGTRRAEGLKNRPTGKLRGMNPPDLIDIVEHDVNLSVDIYHGQKTGYFIDQRANRFQLQKLAAAADVLNLFSYSLSTTLLIIILPKLFPLYSFFTITSSIKP